MVAVNTCGDCTACCTTMGVAELDKAPARRCPHQCAAGCGIYETRPPTCREFECVWLQGTFHGDPREASLRPDLFGFVLVAADPARFGLHVVFAHEVWSGAVEDPKKMAVLEGFAQVSLVVVTSGSRRKVMGPADKEKEIRELARILREAHERPA